MRKWGALFALSLTMALLTGVILAFATSAALFEREMTRFAPPERTGLPETEYAGMAAHIAEYLAGRKESFQYFLPGPGGETIACFHDYEMIHMADCRSLIRLDGIVCGGCALLTAASGVVISRRRRNGLPEAIRGMKRAAWGMSLIAAALILWAVIDFDGLFITFHRTAFRNDYWLLNPRTDLLIRLMPEGMFIDMGLWGLAVFAGGMAVFAALMIAAGRRFEGRGERA